MSLITVFGVNPFEGQSDPYVGMDSSITYDDSPQGTVVNSYSLNGVLTGCSVEELSQLRDNLVASFNWKANTGIIENIKISGVVEASPARQILPTNLSFDASTYIGALPYSMSLDVFTGFEAGDKDDLYNKTHTVNTSIAEDGCITINTSLSVEPNANLAHCDAIEKANEWISGQLGNAKLGAITMQTTYELLNESMDIDPRGGGISYSRTESNCRNGSPNTEQGLSGRHFAYCIDTDTDQAGCPEACQVLTKSYRGEVYDTGASITELVSDIKTRLFPSMAGITQFSATYDQGQSNVTFNATRQEKANGDPVNIPQDLVVNDYTLNINTNYDDPQTPVLGSVNGRVSLLNPTTRQPLEVNTMFNPSSMIDVAKAVCSGSTKLNQQSVTYDNIKGGINYNYGFTQVDGPDAGVPNLEGVSGLSEWTVDYTPPLRKHDIIPNLNCADMILDLDYDDRGSISISVVAISGSGYDYQAVATQKAQDLINTIARNRQELQVTKDQLDTEADSAVYNYAATFKGVSVVTNGNEIGDLL